MTEEISDYRLQHLDKSKIARNPADAKLLIAQLYCGAKLIKGQNSIPAAFVIANREKAKIFGTAMCKNSWACPVCSAVMMSKYAAEIACAIDALREPKYNQLACMITFTVPHTSGMSCYETTEILYNTWKRFVLRGNKLMNHRYYTKDGMQIGKTFYKEPFSEFCTEMNCTHRVRVGEYTWGTQGWHPHFHCLFWVDADKIQKVTKYEEAMRKHWYHICKLETLKMWNKLNPQKRDDNLKRVNIMYSKLDKDSHCVYISKDKSGDVIVQQSSMYICGWGADKELTGNFRAKATHENHLTPHQILDKAYESKGDEREKWLDLYMEYARATRLKRHARINFSTHSGIKNIIKLWKQTQTYREVLKKKAIQQAENVGRWAVIGWFSEQDWLKICLLEKQIPIKAMILEKYHDSYEDGDELLAPYNIRLRRPEEFPDRMFNSFLENEILTVS